jgi:hypothetical protein
MKKTLPVLALVFLLPFGAQAGNERGNGGNTVVCRASSGAISSIELLDYYEARILRGFTLDNPPASMTADEDVARILARLARFKPNQAARITAAAAQFSQNAEFLANTDLVPVDDSAHIIVPAGCTVTQIVIQRTPEFPQDRIYVINQDLWSHLDAFNRAGLILHELLYHEALENPDVVNSVALRYFNAYLATTAMANVTPAEFAAVDSYVPWLNVEYLGVDFERRAPLDGYPGILWADSVETIGPSKMAVLLSTPVDSGSMLRDPQGRSFSLAAVGQEFYPTGSPFQLHLSAPMSLSMVAGRPAFTQATSGITPATISFDSSGAVRFVTGLSPANLTIAGQGFSLGTGSAVELDPQGNFFAIGDMQFADTVFAAPTRQAAFFPSGRLQMLRSNVAFATSAAGLPTSVISMTWDEQGHILSFDLPFPYGNGLTWTVSGQKLQIIPADRPDEPSPLPDLSQPWSENFIPKRGIDLFPSGALATAALAAPATLRHADGSAVALQAGAIVRFNEDGSLK